VVPRDLQKQYSGTKHGLVMVLELLLQMKLLVLLWQ
jgi:hypothetical protein